MLSERTLRPVWYGDVQPSWFLRMLAGVYCSLAALRRGLYQSGLLRAVRLPVPVVVIGNISVGGTGKTPLAIALIDGLRARGLVPGVISRGYGGHAPGPVVVDAQGDPTTVGDEPVLIARSTGAPVAVGRDRVAASRLLLAAAKVDVLIADDGLQHYSLARDVEICVIDGERRFGNRRRLPAGPLREPLARLAMVDFRVCNGGIPGPDEIAMTLDGDIAVALLDHSVSRPLREFRGSRVHAVAAIGNPARFFAQLRAAGLEPIEHPFPDHHPFHASDLEFGDELPVMMTAKDAVKCRLFADARQWCVPVRAQLPAEFFDAVAAKVVQCTAAREVRGTSD
ncbi:MAG: tetraacyldisaccharide 4'-kinase [Rudaea sp.]|nr:tetraacyldisaccharide 4'-kinase [Rudaea sp.]